MSSRRRRLAAMAGRSLLAVALTASAACAGSTSPSSAAGGTAESSGAVPSSATTASRGLVAERRGIVQVAGLDVYAECAGEGSPTVLFEAGDESDHNQWRHVFAEVAAVTRACAYDRLGTGLSDPPPDTCRRADDLRRTLEQVLAALGEKPPWLLVGTSGGGFLMANFAYAHRADVAGLVLAETPHAVVVRYLTPEVRAYISCANPANVEHRDYVQVEHHAWSHRQVLGRVPMTVITNDYGDMAQDHESRTNVRGQRGWLRLSPLAEQVVVTSGHDVPENEPDLTVRVVLEAVTAARG